MKTEKIKPIPQYMQKKIRQADIKRFPEQHGKTRYYAYLTTNDKELVKVTVAVKNFSGDWYCKQCAVHGIHSQDCYVKDMDYTYCGGYQTGWYSEGITKEPKYYETQRWECAKEDFFDPYAPLINKEYISKFPEYKYSGYQYYYGVDMLFVLRTYERYPQTEMLLKAGLSSYIWSKKIQNQIAKDKSFRKWLYANRKELSMTIYYTTSILKAYQTRKPIVDIQLFEEQKNKLVKEKSLRPIVNAIKGNYKRYFAYLEKQKISDRLYLDYINACNYLELDMTEDKNLFPHDFMRWHDIRVNQYSTAKALKDEKERKELYHKFANVSERYSVLQLSNKTYSVLIAKSPAELITEGDKLKHCVGRMDYDKRFVEEQSLIFFVRQTKNLETAFVTMEYSPSKKKVLQCYTFGNRTPGTEVKHFIDKQWLPYANNVLKQITV